MRIARLLLPILLFPAVLSAQTVVTFDAGLEGWSGPQGPGGASSIEATGGNPGSNLRTQFNDFGITFSTETNPGFVFDYTTRSAVELRVDLEVESIFFNGVPVSRPWLVELRDVDNPPAGFPWVSVWFKFADIAQASQGDWTTFSINIADTGAVALPPGWRGFGAEDALGNPMLPADRTFTDVLAGIDEVAFTTLEPGFFFGFTDFDIRIDNIGITLDVIFADGFESADTSAWD